MSSIDTFVESLHQNKHAEALAALWAVLEKKVMTPQERGRVLSELFFAYLKAANSMQEEANAHLEEMIRLMKNLNALEEKVHCEEVRLNLHRS